AQLRRTRGQPVEVSLSVAPVPVDGAGPARDGHALTLRWLARDITPRVRAEHALRAERDFVAALLDNAQALGLVLDQERRTVRTNYLLRQACGRSEAELSGLGWGHLFPEEDHAAVRRLFRQALEQNHNPRHAGAMLTRHRGRRSVVWSGRSIYRADLGSSV